MQIQCQLYDVWHLNSKLFLKNLVVIRSTLKRIGFLYFSILILSRQLLKYIHCTKINLTIAHLFIYFDISEIQSKHLQEKKCLHQTLQSHFQTDFDIRAMCLKYASEKQVYELEFGIGNFPILNQAKTGLCLFLSVLYSVFDQLLINMESRWVLFLFGFVTSQMRIQNTKVKLQLICIKKIHKTLRAWNQYKWIYIPDWKI